jgi:phytoene synthase
MVKRDDPDRWLAGLFIPQKFRPAIFALYAFNLEIARVREIVSEPLLGEIRFQWWQEAIAGERASEAEANPVSAALLETIARYDLPKEMLTELIEARGFDLYDEPMLTIEALEAYADATSTGLFRLVLAVLEAEVIEKKPAKAKDLVKAHLRGKNLIGGQSLDVTGHGGIAYALTGLLRALPWALAKGKIFVPLEILDRHGVDPETLLAGKLTASTRNALADMRALAHGHLRAFWDQAKNISEPEQFTFMPLTLCEAYIKQIEKKSYNPYETLVSLPQWRRQWILWRASHHFG